MLPKSDHSRIELFWIPLGAGGSGLVRFNGRVYERIKALLSRRRPLDLYHTALRVTMPDGVFIIETMWPTPSADGAGRGVVVVAPVFCGFLGRFRLFRYEVRRWRDGILPDAAAAIGGPRSVSSDPEQARHLLELVEGVPPLVWGRDRSRTGEMWNSNSVVSWLLARSGIDMDRIAAPAAGRAPGWDAGVAVARRVAP